MDTSLSRKALHGYQPLKEGPAWIPASQGRPCMDTSLSRKALHGYQPLTERPCALHGYQPLKERPCVDTSLSWKALWWNLYSKLVLFV
jgi:hypothetical protein